MGIVKLLVEGNQIPEEYNPHSLKGNWKNYMECHIVAPCCHILNIPHSSDASAERYCGGEQFRRYHLAHLAKTTIMF